MEDTNWHEWTPCEMHGHRFTLGDETFSTCVDCGEPCYEERETCIP